MNVADLIRELKELADNFGKHVEVVIPGFDDEESPVAEAKYEQGEIHIR